MAVHQEAPQGRFYDPDTIARRRPSRGLRVSLPDLHPVAVRLLPPGMVAAAVLAIAAIGSQHVAAEKERNLQAWHAQMRDKLDGRTLLAANEIHYDQVQVVASGRDWKERKLIEALGRPITVYAGPGAIDGNGNAIAVVGQVPQGTLIDNVITTSTIKTPLQSAPAVGVFDCRSVIGALKNPEGKPVEVQPGQVCAISYNNLQKVASE